MEWNGMEWNGMEWNRRTVFFYFGIITEIEQEWHVRQMYHII